MVLIGLLQKLVSLKTLPAIHETSKHMSGLWLNLDMSKDFSILSMKWPLGQNFHSEWHLEQFPNDKYDQMAYPESQLGELGQLWVLVWVTEDKIAQFWPLSGPCGRFINETLRITARHGLPNHIIRLGHAQSSSRKRRWPGLGNWG